MLKLSVSLSKVFINLMVFLLVLNSVQAQESVSHCINNMNIQGESLSSITEIISGPNPQFAVQSVENLFLKAAKRLFAKTRSLRSVTNLRIIRDNQGNALLSRVEGSGRTSIYMHIGVDLGGRSSDVYTIQFLVPVDTRLIRAPEVTNLSLGSAAVKNRQTYARYYYQSQVRGTECPFTFGGRRSDFGHELVKLFDTYDHQFASLSSVELNPNCTIWTICED